MVLIHYQEMPMAYARIEAIEPDLKKDWYQVTLLFLTIPAETVTWILREAYINGEPFTMGGQPVRLHKVEKRTAGDKIRKAPEERMEKPGAAEKGRAAENPRGKGQGVKVIPFKKDK